MIGQIVGQYRITGKLGEGGMGSVYKAVDTMIGREVAIKMLRPEIARQPNLLQRFRAEAVTVAKLNHSGIATLYSFTQQGDDFFMVMEYIPGKTLEAVERERGALPWKTAVPLFTKILEAIQPAHDLGILHRDIKPANVMLTTWGTVKVMDFGISRMLGAARMTTEGRLVGTIEYIPPERVKGQESDARGDIYSLGVVLFEMLSGRLPFQSDSEYELMRCHLQEPLPSFRQNPVDVPPEIESIVQRATAKSPEDRFSSCDEFAQALQAASGNLSITKKAVIDLVGALTVEQLGTAGHETPAVGLNPEASQASAQAYAVPSATQSVTQPVRAIGQAVNASKASPLAYLRTNWKVTLAIAAVVLSVVAGLLIGLVERHGHEADNAATEHAQPATAITPQGTAPSPVPQPTQENVATPAPPAQPQSPPAVIGQPIQLTTGASDKPRTPSKQKELHKEALKALDQ